MTATLTEKQAYWKREITQRKWDRRRRRREILDRIAGRSTAMFKSESGLAIIVHRCVRADRDNDWQVTTIGADGIPSGHHCAATFAEGCVQAGGASKDSYWNSYGYELIEVH
jgi:hypothetical protein